MSQRTLVVPDIGDFHDVPVIEVLVKPGDRVAKEAPLLTLESDKATMEIPAAEAGVVGEVRIRVGDVVSQGTVIAILETAAPEAPSPAAEPVTREHAASATGAAPEPEPPIPSSYGASGAAAASAPASRNGAKPVEPATRPDETRSPSGPVHASPGVRRFARELGVTIALVRGTGPNGRITQSDVQTYVAAALAAPRSTPSAAATNGAALGLAPWPVVDFTKYGEVERVPLSRIKKISGPSLARNWVMIPHVTQFEEADVTELEAWRKALAAQKTAVKVTMLAFVMKAVAATLARFPEINASLDGDELIIKKYYHLGFAADVPGGLVVPVVRDADRKGILAIASETAALAEKARAGKIGPAEMTGASFTISSLGGIGGTAFTPIINAPEIGILGLSRTRIAPRWNGTAFEPRTILPLSFSYDHRAIDGATAARFVVALAATLADLKLIML